jgi:hypothetical protein
MYSGGSQAENNSYHAKNNQPSQNNNKGMIKY